MNDEFEVALNTFKKKYDNVTREWERLYNIMYKVVEYSQNFKLEFGREYDTIKKRIEEFEESTDKDILKTYNRYVHPVHPLGRFKDSKNPVRNLVLYPYD